jgi:hypothetical protein
MSNLTLSLREPFVLSLLVILVLLWYRYRKGRGVLLIRTAVISILLFVIAEPLITYIRREEVKPTLPILVDVSRSMVIDDPNVRSDSLRLLVERTKSLLEDRFRVDVLQFSNELEASEETLSWVQEGTAIGDVIEAAEKRLDPMGVLIVTDGVSNLGKHPLWVAKYTGFPIFAVGFGPAPPRGDVSVTRVRRNTIVYAEDEVPVEVWIEADGYKGHKTTATLTERERTIDTKEIEFREDTEEQVLEFKVIPRAPGTKIYEISLAPLDGELNDDNNAKTFALKVLKSRNKILYVSSSPSWEHKFLRLLMDTDPTVELHSQILLSDGNRLTQPDDAEITLTRNGLLDYDCYIIQDVPSAAIPPQVVTALKELVGDFGKSLLLIGGERVTDYAGSRLEEMLPVRLEERVLKKPFQVEFTREGEEHPVIKSAGERKDLPPLLGCNEVRGVKPGSEVWASNPAHKTGQGKLPVITRSSYGKGNVVAITGFPLWRWYFLMKGLNQEPSFYTQFFTNLTRWLSVRKEINPLVVELSRPAYETYEEVEFSAELYDEDYRPVDGAFVKVEIEGDEELTLRPISGGKYMGTASNLPPGKYQFTSRAYVGGTEYAVKRGDFEVVEGSVEAEDFGLQEDILESMASLTGGEYYTPENLNDISQIAFPKTEMKRHQTVELLYWPAIYLILLLLLVIEWTVRRARGL